MTRRSRTLLLEGSLWDSRQPRESLRNADARVPRGAPETDSGFNKGPRGAHTHGI